MTVAEEAQLYLAVVEVFRAEGCEPHWRSESPRATRTAEGAAEAAHNTFLEHREGSHE
jgi:hypothetical protein